MICQYCGHKLTDRKCLNPACPGRMIVHKFSLPDGKLVEITDERIWFYGPFDYLTTDEIDVIHAEIHRNDPDLAEVEELLERYKSSWWLLGYEAASHEDYEISEENWAKMNALKSRILVALSNTTPYLSGDVIVPVAQDDCIERIISYVDEYINDQIDRVVLKSEIGLVLDDIFYSYLQKGG